MAVSANRLEFLQIADAVAREKSIGREIIITAMADAIQRAARSRYGQETNIRVDINPSTGDIKLQRLMKIVEHVEDSITQISLKDAHLIRPDLKIGEFLSDPLPPFDFSRVAAQSARQVIVQRVREAERDQQYEEYKNRVGEILSGTVKRVEYGNVFVDLGRGEAILRRDQLIGREAYRYGDSIRAYVLEVSRLPKGPQIFLSRSHAQFMAKLFIMEVPEIYDGIVEIKSVARDPGSRSKIAVVSKDASIDPVGACVGLRGSRVQAVIAELRGEKIDIVPWSPDPANFIVNALQPAEVARVVLDEEAERIEVVVTEDQLSLAIGRRGQNVRLATQLTGWNIDIMTEKESSERRQKEFSERSSLFMKVLDVDEMVGQVLASEGFETVEQIAYTNLSDIALIEGFDEDTAAEVQNRAKEYLLLVEADLDAKRKKLGVKDELLKIDGMTLPMLVAVGEDGVLTIEDFAGYAVDDLVGWREGKGNEIVYHQGILSLYGVTRADAERMILAARISVGWLSKDDVSVNEMKKKKSKEKILENKSLKEDKAKTEFQKQNCAF